MIALDDFQQLQRDVERAKQERAEVRGARTQQLTRLKEEYRCKDKAAGRKELEALTDEELELSREYAEKKKLFEERFAAALGRKP